MPLACMGEIVRWTPIYPHLFVFVFLHLVFTGVNNKHYYSAHLSWRLSYYIYGNSAQCWWAWYEQFLKDGACSLNWSSAPPRTNAPMVCAGHADVATHRSIGSWKQYHFAKGNGVQTSQPHSNQYFMFRMLILHVEMVFSTTSRSCHFWWMLTTTGFYNSQQMHQSVQLENQ